MLLLWSPNEPMYLQYDVNNINVHIVKSLPITPESIAIKERREADLKMIKKSFEDFDLKNLKMQKMIKNINKFEKFISTPEFIFHYNKQKNIPFCYYQKYDINFNLIKDNYKNIH